MIAFFFQNWLYTYSMSNKYHFLNGESDNWLDRNSRNHNLDRLNNISDKILECLKSFKSDINEILEIGAGGGDLLNILSKNLEANAYGVEPSPKAVKFIEKKFPDIKMQCGFGDQIDFENKSFDYVHLGFYLYLVDRELYMRCISEADRVLKFGGFLSILDFDPPFAYSNNYSHKEGVFAHKIDNSKVFTSTGMYSLISKYSFSHSEFCFNKEINERVAITLLYKEKDIFKGCA